MTDSGNEARVDSMADELARTFADRAHALQGSAYVLVRCIVAILIGGLIMIVSLPPAITELDRWIAVGGVQPFIDQLDLQIARLRSELSDIEQSRRHSIEDINGKVALIWRNADIPDVVGSITGVSRIGGEQLIAVGYDGTLVPDELCTSSTESAQGSGAQNANINQTPLILRSQDNGSKWNRMVVTHIKGDLVRLVDIANRTMVPVYHATVAVGRADGGALILRQWIYVEQVNCSGDVGRI